MQLVTGVLCITILRNMTFVARADNVDDVQVHVVKALDGGQWLA